MMPKNELTDDFINQATKNYQPWRLGNEFLYNLCKAHPYHHTCAEIVAKFWLIGRSYSVAVERRKERGEFEGDEFYTRRLVPAVRKWRMDDWFDELRRDYENVGENNIRIHSKLTKHLSEISGQGRSLASKYLHFHFPDRFYIYDAYAWKGLWSITDFGKYPRAQFDIDSADREYTKFYLGCEFLKKRLEEKFKRKISHRDLDCILVSRGWQRKKESQRVANSTTPAR